MVRPVISSLVVMLIVVGTGNFRDWIDDAFLGLFGLLAAATAMVEALRGLRNETQNPDDGIDPAVPRLGSLLYLLTVTSALLDSGRLHWSPALPGPLRIVALAIVALFGSLELWAKSVNPFFSPSLSIRTQHQFVARGPYRLIRHPGYLAMVITMPATALTLGSVAALLPAIGYDFLILNRTIREDGLLRQQLRGYPEYAKIVRYRIVPCLW